MNGPSAPADSQIAADPMIVIRAERLRERLGYADPHARLFLTDGSRALFKIAERLDPLFAELNLARFRQFSERMVRAASFYRQMVLLGAGYDTRPLWLKGLAGKDIKVFEVDFAMVLDGKAEVLQENGIKVPGNVVPVPADLNEPGLLAALKRAGYDPDLPTAVFAENVFFFLLADSVTRIIDPRGLKLADGSSFSFDFWSRTRINSLNVSLIAATGRPMFDSFPLPDQPAALGRRLRGMGYATAEIVALAELADQYWPEEDHKDNLGTWYAVHTIMD